MPASIHFPVVLNNTSLTDQTDASFTARLAASGLTFEAPASLPLLEAAQLAGFTLPSSCRNGTCRACICQLLGGQVIYRIEWPGLSAEEKREGLILPCVAYPVSNVVIAPSTCK